MKKCINHANSTFNLYILYIKLAQNTKHLRRLALENFITVVSVVPLLDFHIRSSKINVQEVSIDDRL